jgi:hypothetical protein
MTISLKDFVRCFTELVLNAVCVRLLSACCKLIQVSNPVVSSDEIEMSRCCKLLDPCVYCTNKELKGLEKYHQSTLA